MKRPVIVVLLITALAVIFFFFSTYFKEKKLDSIRTTGIVRGTEVNLSPEISGIISELCCREGSTVKAGSVVVRLDSDEVRASVEQAEASILRATADVQTAEATIGSAAAHLDEAKRRAERVTNLYKEDLVSQADYDLAVTNLNSALAEYNASQSHLSSSQARLKEAEAALAFQKARLNDTIIKAPISGVVTFRALEPGEFVSPGMTIVTVVDMKNLWVRVDVEESLVGLIGLGGEARITLDAAPEKVIDGNISEIGRYAQFATQRDVRHGQQDIKTFHVKIRVEDTDNMLKPGMTVNVEIPVNAKSQ